MRDEQAAPPNILQRLLFFPFSKRGGERGCGNPRRGSAFPSRVWAVPDGLRIYAIGDIHGCHAQLESLLTLIDHDVRDANIAHCVIYLGDYIDRGPASKDVVDSVLKTRLRFRTICLRGNHDQMLLDFLDEPAIFPKWSAVGGRETLLSYGVSPPQFDDERIFCAARDALWSALPKAHYEFFSSLRFSVKIGDYFFVHAGVRPGTALDDQDIQDMLWIREDFLKSSSDFGAMIVHGHTPSAMPVRHVNRIGLDTAAYATGRLTAAVLEGTGFRFLHT
jgi:serine/threonine protein phosphatase 1